MKKSRKIILWGLLFALVSSIGAVVGSLTEGGLMKMFIMISLAILFVTTIIRMLGGRFDIYLDLLLSGTLGVVLGCVKPNILWFVATAAIALIAMSLIFFGYTGYSKEEEE